MKTIRYETFQIDADNIEITPQGFLRVPVIVGRTGIQLYRQADGSTIREFRPPEEVFRRETMDSLKNLPVTDEHPTEMVTAENAKRLTVGFTGETVERFDGRFQKTKVTITDAAMIKKIQNGKRQVSLGYSLNKDETPGVYKGQRYDRIQRDIIANHLAITDRGRAGKEVSLRLDSDDAVFVEEIPFSEEMMKVKIGTKEFDVADDVASAIKDLQKDHADQLAEKDKAMDEMKTAHTDSLKEKQTELDTVQANFDALKEKEGEGNSNMDADQVNALVRERSKVLSVATKLLPADRHDSLHDMSNVEIQKECIKQANSKANLDGKSDVYIAARFDHIAETAGASKAANDKISKDAAAANKDAADDKANKTPDQIRKDAMAEAQERWKQPVGRTK